jgi:hypothetical protein
MGEMGWQEYAYLQEIAKKCADKGDFVVCGTYDGTDVRAIKTAAPASNIVVVDSFEGLAAPIDIDKCQNTCSAGHCNIGGLQAYLKTFNNTGIEPPKEIYKLWITPESLKIITKRPVSFLFMDLDHYQPTKACLDYFKPMLFEHVNSEFASIITHDYEFDRCPGIKRACDEFGGVWEKVPNTLFAIWRK